MVKEEHKGERELAKAHHIDALMKAIKSANICVFFQTPDLIYHWVENLPEFLRGKWSSGARDTDIFPLEAAERLEDAKLQVLASGECQDIQLHFFHKDETIWYNFSIDRHTNESGIVTGLVTTAVNISQIRCREQILKTLVREVCHRSKNLLAMVQAIARQSARFGASIPDYLKRFQGRLEALSRSQDLIVHSDWFGAYLRELIGSQIEGLIDEENHDFSLEGKDAYLFPNAALHVGLAVHELLINSLSYGALSQTKGKVKVLCVPEEAEGNSSEDKRLVLVWEETFSTPVPKDKELNRCFGSNILENIVPAAVSGSSHYKVHSEGVLYKLWLASSQFEENKQ